MTPEEIDWADGMSRKIKDVELRRWWERHENRGKRDQEKRIDPVMSRIYDLASPELRYILGQSRSTFQLRDVLAENKILLVNLKGMNVDADTANLIGTLLMNLLWHNAMHLTGKSVPTFVMLDEFHRFMDLPVDMETMLAQARKHRLPFVLATQGMDQLSKSVKNAVVTNARNKIIFESNAEDGALLGKHMANEFGADDITTLELHQAIASILTPAGPSGPVSIKTRKPKVQSSYANAIRQISQTRYGRPLRDVQQEIERRYQPEKPKPTRPLDIGGTWKI